MKKIVLLIGLIFVMFTTNAEAGKDGDFIYEEITATEASKLIDSSNPFILDVRTEGEFASGHSPEATLIPVQVIGENLDKLEMYKNEPIFIYCRSGNRSTVASKILIEAGFNKIYNLEKGIGDWINSGLPIEK